MEYEIKEMKIEELKETLQLVKIVFDEFEAPDYSKEGIENFYKFANYNSISEKLRQNMKIFVAKFQEKIVGMIGFRDYSHISMLFVDKAYHKQGIARELVNEAKLECRVNNKNLENMTVNSSPYAVEFYHKLGFVDTDVEQIVDGIKFTPMILKMYYFDKYDEKNFNYLYEMKKDCFKWYVEEIYRLWDDEFQIKLFKSFTEEHRDDINVIKMNEEIIGVFTNYIDANNESVISLFYIDKAYQGKGIGKEILKYQLKIDEENKRSTTLQVYKDNPARFLYKNVGFEVYEETNTHYKMRRKI